VNPRTTEATRLMMTFSSQNNALRLICEFGEPLKFGGGAVVKEFHSATKQGSPQTRRNSDNQKIIYG